LAETCAWLNPIIPYIKARKMGVSFGDEYLELSKGQVYQFFCFKKFFIKPFGKFLNGNSFSKHFYFCIEVSLLLNKECHLVLHFAA
jgi:hypothetical protein